MIAHTGTPAPAPRLHWGRFALTIISPAIVTFGLFIVLIAAVIMPAMERNIIDRKREMIRELTHAAWSELVALHEQEQQGLLDRAAAQKAAIALIERLRYGDEGKDYFWISDMHPHMVVHPYRPELNGRDLSDHFDRAGRRMFVEFKKTVENHGEGYVEYFWQWKDDEDRVVPKLSFVKGFAPWGWIIGTGIYLEDVRAEISRLTRQVLHISIGISLVVALLLGTIAKQGLNIERQRWRTERALRDSEEKYRLLVEGTTGGILLVVRDRVVFANKTLLKLLGCSEREIEETPLAQIMDPAPSSEPGEGAVVAEQAVQLLRKDGERVSVQVSVAPVMIDSQPGCILSVTNRTGNKDRQDTLYRLLAEMETVRMLPTQPLKTSNLTLVSCGMGTPVKQAAAAMSRAGSSAILVQAPAGGPIGIVTDSDLRNRVLAAGRDGSTPVEEVMSSPLVRIADHALYFEAMREMRQRDIQHLVVTTESGAAQGILTGRDLLRAQRHTVSAMLAEIDRAESPEELRQIRTAMPVLVKSLLESGTRVEHVTRIMSTVTDAIVVRLVALATRELGPPPAGFTFVALGSEARGEQTLATDQDNALIFDDVEPARLDEVQAYFLRLGERVCGWLDTIGYQRCRGEVMAMNPKWCQPLARWRTYFSECVRAANPQDLLDVNVFFDFRNACGDGRHVTLLREHLRERLAGGGHEFFFHLAESTLQFKPPLSFFGKIQAEPGGEHAPAFNIKNAIIPIVNFARIYALREHVAETNTLERLQQLLRLGVLVQSSHDELVQAYTVLTQMRLTHQASRAASGAEPDNLIELGQLTPIERSLLKKVFADVAVFQTRMRSDFARTS